MKIVVLDGYTAVQNDLSWKEMESLGFMTVHVPRKLLTVARVQRRC